MGIFSHCQKTMRPDVMFTCVAFSLVAWEAFAMLAPISNLAQSLSTHPAYSGQAVAPRSVLASVGSAALLSFVLSEPVSACSLPALAMVRKTQPQRRTGIRSACRPWRQRELSRRNRDTSSSLRLPPNQQLKDHPEHVASRSEEVSASQSVRQPHPHPQRR